MRRLGLVVVLRYPRPGAPSWPMRELLVWAYVSQLGNELVISDQELDGATQMDLRGYGITHNHVEMCKYRILIRS